MKKIINLLMVLTLLLTSIFTFTGCKTENGDENIKDNANYTVALNEYNIELGVAETFTIAPKKFNSTGKEVSISKVTYVVEAPEIASVDKNGVIIAKQIGGTYINVDVDGIETACFVSVKTAENNGIPYDIGWGPYCIESGWTVGEILMGLQFMQLAVKTVK